MNNGKLNFENTEIAFRLRSDKELRSAYLMFKIISSSTLVSMGNLAIPAAVRTGIPMGWLIKPTVYKQFCGGETISECNRVVNELGSMNVKTILDYSVESKDDDDEIENALTETLRTVENAGNIPYIPFAVFKPTAFIKTYALEILSNKKDINPEAEKEGQKFKSRVERLCSAAFNRGVPVLIDAEDSFYQPFIDEVVLDMMKIFNNEKAIVFNTYQMYRWDRMGVLQDHLSRAKENGFFLGAKFVRGAYMERERARARKSGYPDPIHKDKESTDRDYDAALKYSIENIDTISIFNGTHNEESSYYLTELMQQSGIRKDDPRIWFSQLYGMSDHISFNLARDGYNVAKYVPYGQIKHVLPYLMRRVKENTSVKGQTGRELSLIIKELNRRKKIKG